MMKRVPEPELMNDKEQARAYANADFEEPHSHFIELFRARFPGKIKGETILDLGCGSADIAIRFAWAYPDCHLVGVDGSASMLNEARKAIDNTSLRNRITLIQARLPGIKLPHDYYNTIISNSLLHHLHNPAVLWKTINKYSTDESRVFIMDLMRPDSEEAARQLVDTYAANEPDILRRDFYNSLKAAFTLEEVREQLVEASLDYWIVEQVSDRHLIVYNHNVGMVA